jgi:hypothetical protein
MANIQSQLAKAEIKWANVTAPNQQIEFSADLDALVLLAQNMISQTPQDHNSHLVPIAKIIWAAALASHKAAAHAESAAQLYNKAENICTITDQQLESPATDVMSSEEYLTVGEAENSAKLTNYYATSAARFHQLAKDKDNNRLELEYGLPIETIADLFSSNLK